MSKYAAFLLILLFVVGTVTINLYGSDGVQKDLSDMKDNSKTIIQDANDSMTNLSNDL